jgi:predicted secreted hydrolase
MIAGDAEGYALVEEPRPFVFPRDHGPHPEYRTEWWYFVGHLETEGDRRFGYQLTFFRQALAPEADPGRTSRWATRDIYMAHFALTDVDGARFHSAERFARAAADLAGAKLHPFTVWTEDWSARAEGDTLFPLVLTAQDEGRRLELRLESPRPPVLQGEAGYSRKGSGQGAASYYYSYTRLEAAGSLELNGEVLEVSGSGWLDREWSTSGLEPGQVGWDWFALQLDDGHDLMVYQIRQEDGGIEPLSHGSLGDPAGTSRTLALDEVELEVLDHWRSPEGTRYPARWRLRIPGEGLDLEIRPLLADQELDVTFRYWEGAVDVTGTAGGRPVEGRGYVELVGYGAAPGDGGS